MNLPKPTDRVFITGLFAGLFSQHVCVVPDATDEEILAEVNKHEKRFVEPGFKWDIVMRTKADAEKAGTVFAAPGPCKECPPRIHLVIRSTSHCSRE